MRKNCRFVPLAAVLFLSSICTAADDFSAYYKSLKTVFAKYYPAVTFSEKEDMVVFDHNTRLFQIHEPTKLGEWQDATAQRGPNEGGIYCEIVRQNGPYHGQAEVPQTFNKYYFSILLLAPYNKRLDRHLHVLLYYPAGASKEFLKEIAEAFGKFGEI